MYFHFQTLILLHGIKNIINFIYPLTDIFAEELTDDEKDYISFHFAAYGLIRIILVLDFNYVSKLLLCLIYSIDIFFIWVDYKIVKKIKNDIKHFWLFWSIFTLCLLLKNLGYL
jgi:hypothetical protein